MLWGNHATHTAHTQYIINLSEKKATLGYFSTFTAGKCISFNRLSRRKRGMVSDPLFIIPDFFCIFPMNVAMATLGLKEMGKFLWEGRKKVCPVGCLSLVLPN